MNELYQQTETGNQLDGIIKPLIYSKRAIYGFSIFFTSLFGGILLMQNLRDIDKKKEANIVLLVSILLTVLTGIIANEIKGRSVSIGCNIVSAVILSEYFYKKYFPDEIDYEKKKIWKPLIIGLAICAILIFLAFWAQDQVVQ